MSHPYVHAESSAKIFGGVAEDYIKIHSWYDETKAWTPDWRHRAIRHHVEGIRECMSIFGETVINSEGKEVSLLEIGVQHQIEDVGFLPTAKDWFDHFDEQSWEDFRNEKVHERIRLPKEIGEKIPKSVREILVTL